MTHSFHRIINTINHLAPEALAAWDRVIPVFDQTDVATSATTADLPALAGLARLSAYTLTEGSGCAPLTNHSIGASLVKTYGAPQQAWLDLSGIEGRHPMEPSGRWFTDYDGEAERLARTARPELLAELAGAA